MGTRISLIVLLTSGLALLLTGIALFVHEREQQRGVASHELWVRTGILANNCAVALSSMDRQAGDRALQALRADSQVVEAALYDGRGEAFVRYRDGGTSVAAGALLRQEGSYFENGALLSFRAVRLQDARVGTIFLKSTTQEMNARLSQFSERLGLALGISILAAWALGRHLRGGIAGPLRELSAMAREAPQPAGDEIGWLVGAFHDLRSRVAQQDLALQTAKISLQESEQRYALTAEGARDGLWDWKIVSNEVYFSARWRQMLGLGEGDVGSSPDDWLGRIHPSDRERVRAQIAAHFEGVTPAFVAEYRVQRKDGAFVWMSSRGVAIRDGEGQPVRMAGSQTDITEGKVADPLTGLPNRLYMVDKLESALDGARYSRGQFAVLFLDLDRFKLVNDSMGHAAGDELLIEIATRLRSALRGADASGNDPGWSATIARLGGDEFAVLLTNIRSEKDAVHAAERLLKHLSASIHLKGRQVLVSASIGIAMSSSATTPEDLLRNADTAMYHAKAMGKARFEIFDESMRARATEQVEIESGLRRALENRELVLFYQAQISTASRQVTGFEALVRWNHPKRGILGPSEFIPIAEESGLILQIGHWVLREACTQMVKWKPFLPSNRPVTMSVNVSPLELRQSDFVEGVEQVLADTGLDPRCLNLELTESSIMGDADNALDTLCRLKRLNIGLEIDDFGTGYSSLSYLQRLPFDTVKIDRSFIKELMTDAGSGEIVRTILELTRSLGMSTVAEGVETGDQVHKLTKLGCDHIQGFYFSKPVKAQAALALALAQETSRVVTSPLPTDPLGTSLLALQAGLQDIHPEAQEVKPVEVAMG